jgi:hypothetical protein
MYDANKILPVLVIFLVLITLPLWYNPLTGRAAPMPELTLPEDAEQCVEEAELMRGEHMQILDDWRDEVVRDGERYYVHPDGETYEKSLTNTCLGCHGQKAQFCDKCHDYAGAEPYCWDCHIAPEEEM